MPVSSGFCHPTGCIDPSRAVSMSVRPMGVTPMPAKEVFMRAKNKT